MHLWLRATGFVWPTSALCPHFAAITMWMVGNELNGAWHLFVCEDDYARDYLQPYGIERCQFGGDAAALLRAIDELCSEVTQEGLLCSTALARCDRDPPPPPPADPPPPPPADPTDRLHRWPFPRDLAAPTPPPRRARPLPSPCR